MATYLTKKSSKARFNAKLPDDLYEWARDYAQRKNTTVTQLIVDHLRELRLKDTDIPQI